MDIILVASLTAVRPVSSVTGTIRRLLDFCLQHCATRRSPPPGRPSVTRDLAGVCHFSIKTASYRHRKTHCGDKTIVLYNGICPILIKWHLDVETDPGVPQGSFQYQIRHLITTRPREVTRFVVEATRFVVWIIASLWNLTGLRGIVTESHCFM